LTFIHTRFRWRTLQPTDRRIQAIHIAVNPQMASARAVMLIVSAFEAQ
jgi:hypothetical protein